MNKLRIFKDFWHFMLERKAWWLTPILLFLVLLGFLVFATHGTVVAPFIYALF